ncbi:MAG: phospholipid carrier-dependent glycosyltransferase, partial [Pseudomonadota bacterium]
MTEAALSTPDLKSAEALTRHSAPLEPQERVADPWAWCFAIPAIFAALATIRLTLPSTLYFDEVHYIPAAREFLKIGTEMAPTYLNQEHPLFGKMLLAVGMAVLGDNPLGWRIMPLLAGAVTVGASMRALWHASCDRFAVIAFGILLVTGFHLFIHARIAMLDIFMAAFLAIAAWHFAAACRKPEGGRGALAVTGIALGLAMGAKWNAVPLAMVPGLTFFAARLSAGRRRLFSSTRGIPVPGISLAEAFLWLGLVPLAVYAATFAPGFFLTGGETTSPLMREGLIAFQVEMLRLQSAVMTPHSYQSTWPQWMLNTRGIWYLYEFIDNEQRGVLLIGNPLTMLAGLPALAWCLISGVS